MIIILEYVRFQKGVLVMEAAKFVLCVIGTLYGLKWILGGVTFRTSPGWDMSKNPPEFKQNGLPVGPNVITLQFVFMGVGAVVLYFSIPYLWNTLRLLF